MAVTRKLIWSIVEQNEVVAMCKARNDRCFQISIQGKDETKGLRKRLVT